MGILDLFRGSKDERIAKRVIAELRAAGEKQRMEFAADEDAIIVFDAKGVRAGMRNLANLRHELAHTEPAQHDSIYQRYARGLMESASAAPLTYAEARPLLRLALRDSGYGERCRLMSRQSNPAKETIPMFSRPIAGDLSAYCVVDRELAIDYVTPEQLVGWGVEGDVVMEDAHENTRAMSFTTDVTGPLHFVMGPNAYNVSCLLCTDSIRKLGVNGAPVAAAATRDSLTITGSDDLAGLELLARLFEAEIKEGNRHVCGRPLVLTDEGWKLFDPPESLRARFLAIANQYDAFFWNDYKEMLSTDLEARGEDVFVATLGIFEEQGTGAAFSAVVWSRDVDTILPPAERVFFYDSDDESKYLAPWTEVQRVMGAAMRKHADIPCSFRVQEFPSASQFMEMGAKKV